MSGDDKQNTAGTADKSEEADTASGGSPEEPDTSDSLSTDENDRPLENPSGG